jgi:hypothetical protein
MSLTGGRQLRVTFTMMTGSLFGDSVIRFLAATASERLERKCDLTVVTLDPFTGGDFMWLWAQDELAQYR